MLQSSFIELLVPSLVHSSVGSFLAFLLCLFLLILFSSPSLPYTSLYAFHFIAARSISIHSILFIFGPFHSCPFHSIAFYSISFHCIAILFSFLSISFRFVPFHHVLLIPFHSIAFSFCIHFDPFFSNLFHFILCHSGSFHSLAFYSILFHFAQFHNVALRAGVAQLFPNKPKVISCHFVSFLFMPFNFFSLPFIPFIYLLHSFITHFI